MEGEGLRDPAGANCGEDLGAEGVVVDWVGWIVGGGPKLVHGEEDGVVFVDAVAAAVVFIDALEGDVGGVVFD